MQSKNASGKFGARTRSMTVSRLSGEPSRSVDASSSVRSTMIVKIEETESTNILYTSKKKKKKILLILKIPIKKRELIQEVVQTQIQ
jgi:hypothetical protein